MTTDTDILFKRLSAASVLFSAARAAVDTIYTDLAEGALTAEEAQIKLERTAKFVARRSGASV